MSSVKLSAKPLKTGSYSDIYSMDAHILSDNQPPSATGLGLSSVTLVPPVIKNLKDFSSRPPLDSYTSRIICKQIKNENSNLSFTKRDLLTFLYRFAVNSRMKYLSLSFPFILGSIFSADLMVTL